MPITIPASGVRAGTVAHFAAATPPTGWLACTGAAVPRSLYGALFLAIGTHYGVGEPDTFRLPDLRGEFIRGLDGGRNVDAGRVIGTTQDSQMQSHNHVISHWLANAGTTADLLPNMVTNANTNTTTFTQPTGGTTNNSENRPRNVAMLACIKF